MEDLKNQSIGMHGHGLGEWKTVYVVVIIITQCCQKCWLSPQSDWKAGDHGIMDPHNVERTQTKLTCLPTPPGHGGLQEERLRERD